MFSMIWVNPVYNYNTIDIDNEQNYCGQYNNNNDKCIHEKCWYDTHQKKCMPSFLYTVNKNHDDYDYDDQ